MTLFNQDFMSFIKSKTNWASFGSLMLGLYMLKYGTSDMSYMLIMQGLTGLGIRDAISKGIMK